MYKRWSLNAIAERFGRSKSAIYKIVKKWRRQGTIERTRGTGLMNKKSTNVQDANLIQYLEENPFETANEAAHITNFPASQRTAQRRIRETSNLRSRIAAS
ncbi:hypothetical protein ABEB36_004548 [Hypothenemus hampei]|uniref:Transposase n=1 Tax=Hypothenemus hampei TaxID=57062 RepID=A0ABD1F6T0_HYPHA